MRHEEARLACSRRLDEDISPEETDELGLHLSSCPDCRAFARALAMAAEALASACASPSAVPV